MPNSHKARSKDDSDSPSSSTSSVRIAFYDSTPYFREYFRRVADEEKADVRFKWCVNHIAIHTVSSLGKTPLDND